MFVRFDCSLFFYAIALFDAVAIFFSEMKKKKKKINLFLYLFFWVYHSWIPDFHVWQNGLLINGIDWLYTHVTHTCADDDNINFGLLRINGLVNFIIFVDVMSRYVWLMRYLEALINVVYKWILQEEKYARNQCSTMRNFIGKITLINRQ